MLGPPMKRSPKCLNNLHDAHAYFINSHIFNKLTGSEGHLYIIVTCQKNAALIGSSNSVLQLAHLKLANKNGS